MAIEANEKNFESEVLESDIPVIVDFWASWCGPCQMMGPVFEELSKDYSGKMKFVKVSTEESPNLANEHAIRSIPCLVIFENGKEKDRIIGMMPKEELKRVIDEKV